MSEQSIETPHHPLKAYLAVPEGKGPWPGVVVIHDVFGMSPDLRRNADWLARSGYLALAPDLFSWGGKIRCLRATVKDLLAQDGPSFDDIDAVRTWLRKRPDCTGKIGIMGFCMGGAYALFMAPGHEFSVSSVNYGTIPKNPETVLKGACPIVGSFGARDRTLKGAAAQLEGVLTSLGVDHDIKEYPDAGHSFLNNHDSLLFKTLGKVIGGAYHEPTERDARKRILRYFGTYLK